MLLHQGEEGRHGHQQAEGMSQRMCSEVKKSLSSEVCRSQTGILK